MLRNAAFLLTTELITRLAALALAVAVARATGSAGYGHYTYALAYAATFGAFADFGTGRLLTRRVAANPAAAARLLTTALLARPLLLVPSLAVAIALAFRQPAIQRSLLFLLLGAATAQSFAAIGRSVCYGFERMELDTASRLLERLVAVGGAFVALGRGNGLPGVAVAFLLAGGIDLAIVGILTATRLVRPSRQIQASAIRKLLCDAAPLGLFGVVLTLQSSIPLYILAAFRGAGGVGSYSAAVTPLLALIPLPVTVAAAALPSLARLAAGDADAFHRAYALLWRLFALVGVAAAPGLAIIAGPLIALVYGPAFAGSVPALQLVAVGLLGMFPTQVCINVLVATDRQRDALRIDVVALMWQIAVDIVAVPRFGAGGAAFATASAEILVGTLFFAAANRAGGAPNLTPVWRALPAAASMAGVAAGLLHTSGLAAAIAGGVFSYGLLLWVCRSLTGADIAECRTLLGRQITKG